MAAALHALRFAVPKLPQASLCMKLSAPLLPSLPSDCFPRSTGLRPDVGVIHTSSARNRCSLPWPPAAGGLRPLYHSAAARACLVAKSFGFTSANGTQATLSSLRRTHPTHTESVRPQLPRAPTTAQGTDTHYRGLRRLGGSAPQTPLL